MPAAGDGGHTRSQRSRSSVSGGGGAPARRIPSAMTSASESSRTTRAASLPGEQLLPLGEEPRKPADPPLPRGGGRRRLLALRVFGLLLRLHLGLLLRVDGEPRTERDERRSDDLPDDRHGLHRRPDRSRDSAPPLLATDRLVELRGALAGERAEPSCGLPDVGDDAGEPRGMVLRGVVEDPGVAVRVLVGEVSIPRDPHQRVGVAATVGRRSRPLAVDELEVGVPRPEVAPAEPLRTRVRRGAARLSYDAAEHTESHEACLPFRRHQLTRASPTKPSGTTTASSTRARPSGHGYGAPFFWMTLGCPSRDESMVRRGRTKPSATSRSQPFTPARPRSTPSSGSPWSFVACASPVVTWMGGRTDVSRVTSASAVVVT